MTDSRNGRVGQILAAATDLHRGGRANAAEAGYLEVLEIAPGHPDALHFLGVLRHQQGRSDEAVELIRSALETVPHNVSMRSNLGNVLKETGRLDEAESCYLRVLDREPGFADAHCNLGIVRRERGDLTAAVDCFRRAVDCEPGHAESHLNLGLLAREKTDWKSALEHFRCALEHHRTAAIRDQSARNLLVTLQRVGRTDESVAVLRRWLDAAPDNPVARHMLAAMSGENVPARASDDYVCATFDSFASSFDNVLERLNYRAPQLVAAEFERFVASLGDKPSVLDAACGTGLVGELIQSRSARLVGVDLAPKMLERAARREVYDQLIESELTAYLGNTHDRFDVITCVDSLIYFGDLRAVLRGARRVIRAGGWFCFTLERITDETGEQDFELQANGRYRHRRSYVRSELDAAGFTDISLTDMHAREELGEPVESLLAVARVADP
jgi:predicted TPR repeat methyltransferase